MTSLFLSSILLAIAVSGTQAPAGNPEVARIASEASGAAGRGEAEKAVELYRDGLRSHPSWAEGWWALGGLLYSAERFPEALAAFRKFAAVSPEARRADAVLGLCEYETRDYESALKHFEFWAARKSPAAPELTDAAAFHWALLLTRAGRFAQAEALLAMRAKAGDHSPALVEALGLAALRIGAVPEEYASVEREPVWLAGRTVLEASLGRWEQADLESKKLQLHFGQHANTHYLAGDILMARGDAAGAAAQFELESRVAPANPAPLVQLALCKLRLRDAAGALRAADRAVALGPQEFGTHAARGEALLAAGRAADAVAELEAAQKLAPGNTSVRAALARARATHGGGGGR